ncbi:MAG: TIGR00730 family Rossman fold protein [Gammaproteobacteria bacterium]|uniref:LOG family protein n=1 Tax=Pseudomaricurvus alcaniphilus TaxID=1166482 RepID=UPI00140E46E5|nr:TIGR00730 family Rossman fold protein [Pseudomaricurvus alcaniphilus]MBR9912303.1 TIGR00730 family Rossman fold protein [Gammaproteobacteria bacterium]NHN39338.1 TIGR00730 family Rossman fold protein [Pseudomaricurvus alcaniphilus]
MADSVDLPKVFPSAGEDADASRRAPDTPQTRSPSYRLAFTDADFLLREDLRPVRLQLELLKPDLLQDEYNIHSTVVIFGSARIYDIETATARLAAAEDRARANSGDARLARKARIAARTLANAHYYAEARKLAQLITADTASDERCQMVVVTGGGPGIMEAANRGAMDVGGKSIGLNIVLPFEQQPNPYITPELCFQFHYFAIRKMHFLKRAKALVACPGGFGTMDELFETLTLIQTQKVKPLPVLLLGSDYWSRVIDFELMVDEGVISESDLDLFQIIDSADQAWEIIKRHYGLS